LANAAPSTKMRVATWLFNRILTVANRRVNIRKLQDTYNANEARILEVDLTDLGRKFHFRVNTGRLEMLADVKEKIVGGMKTNSDTLMALALGQRKRMNPATGEVSAERYTPFDALTHGDIHIWGDAASNEALLFAKAVQEHIYPQIQAELIEAQRS